MQAINGFRDNPPCKGCEMLQEPASLLPPAIEWYGTHRLDARTAGFLEERFGRRMISLRRHSAQTKETSICWQLQPQFPHSLILCRFNVSVLELFLKLPQSCVVNGAALSKRLRNLSEKKSQHKPNPDDQLLDCSAGSLKKFASRLNKEALQDLIERLDKMDLDIDLFERHQAHHLITTVHQAKGFECDHVALHSELHVQEEDEGTSDEGESTKETKEEINIRYVAFSRHLKSLTLLTTATASSEPTSSTSTQTNADALTPADSAHCNTVETFTFQVGAQVRIVDLQGNPRYNGRLGEVAAVSASRRWYTVIFKGVPGEQHSVMDKNLMMIKHTSQQAEVHSCLEALEQQRKRRMATTARASPHESKLQKKQ